jgi:ABC-type enterochelin transport system substrate-binding protein
MKKMMLGLVVVVMMLAMVGCGGDTTNTETEKENVTVESEVTEVVNGLTGEKETIVEKEPEVEIVTIFAEVKSLSLRDNDTNHQVKFEYLNKSGEVRGFGGCYPVGTFEVGDVVKFTFEKKDGLVDYSNKLSWEIVEE